jgi:lipopolysaccharide transport system permease protein
VYTPSPVLAKPARLARDMVRDLLASRELAWRLFVRDLSAQYRQSVLGVTWALLPPLAMGLVFIVLQSGGVVRVADTGVPYPVFVLVGTLCWQVFVDALNAPLKAVAGGKGILAKVNFPREALILSAGWHVGFQVLVKTVVLLGVLLWFGVPFQSGMLWAPLAVALLVVLGLAIGLLLTPVGLLYTDVGSALLIFTQVWFFATPVVYPPPETFPLSLLAALNPVSPLLTAARDLLLHGTIGNPLAFTLVGVLSVACLLVAWVAYRIAMPILVERMSA